MAEQRKRNIGRRAGVSLLLFSGVFLMASGFYREEIQLTESDRGFATANMGLANELPFVDRIPEDQPVRVLSLDAGGIRGIIELQVLVHLEEMTGKSISELFDVIVGTSTGAVISVGLLIPDDEGNPRFTARELLEIYENQVRSLSEVPWYHSVMTLDGLLGPQYSVEPGRAFVSRNYGMVSMGDLLGDAVVALLDLENLEPRFISSRQINRPGGRTMRDNFLACDTVMACCAVPMLVPPMVIRNVEGERMFVGLDGGAFAFAPAPFAVSEVMHRYPGRQIVMLSLGTGMVPGGWEAEDARSWGSIDWVSASMPIMLRSQVRYAEEIMQKMASDKGTVMSHYLRMNPSIPADLEVVSVGSSDVVDRLDAIGEELVSNHQEDITELMSRLHRN